jgi:type II secretory pathway component PulM
MSYILLALSKFLTALQQLPFCTDVEALALDKTAVSGLNQARILFDTIIATAPSARLQLPPEHSQLAAVTKKIYDITKAAAAATTPSNTQTSDKKDVSVSLRQLKLFTSFSDYARALASRKQEVQVFQDHHPSTRRRSRCCLQCRRGCC